MWTEEVELSIQNYSRCHIHAIVEPTVGKPPWKFTSFYGHPEPHKRHEVWGLLRHLADLSPEPWVCLGDFNEIVDMSEKIGGRERASGQMEVFRHTLLYCTLSDLGGYGPKFTWQNEQEGEYFIQERLDRGVANRSGVYYFRMRDYTRR